ncbi:MAG: amidohydrolase [Betaproteobacteria bacterium]|nr:amidohydrolase [Betaproteobacteria bacterium]
MRNERRRFLGAAGCAAALATLGGCRLTLEHGISNPCRTPLPDALSRHEAVRAAWEGIDAARVWDSHAHLLGTGDSGSGIWLNPGMSSVLRPVQLAQRLFFLNAACVDQTPGRVDESYVERMRTLIEGMPAGVKVVLLAFERAYTEDGEPSPAGTSLHVPDGFVMAVARRHPDHFEWAASIHPYRRDCVDALHAAKANGARAVKWLPAAMSIDPASPRCDAFYAALKDADLPLITHAGAESAVPVGDRQHLGNPLLLRRALEHGVRVVVAHCATMGQDRDLDRGADGPWVESFSLFARLMDEARFARNLYGDLSAVAQVNRAGPALVRLLEREDWHARLLNGSDYPLPGVMPLFSMDQLAQLRVIEPGLGPVLAAIREHNPLLFDFVLKRHLRSGNARFPRRVFETRAFFAP